jgi:hypothetical protein
MQNFYLEITGLVYFLVVTLMASPAYAVAIVANIGGTVNINSNNDTTTTKENNETTNANDSLVF